MKRLAKNGLSSSIRAHQTSCLPLCLPSLLEGPSSRNSERRRIQVVLPYGVGGGDNGVAGRSSGSASGGGGRHRRGLNTSGSVTGGGSGLLDSPATTALEAQLNEARRIKRGRDLRRERHEFLSRLNREREERVSLEAWAATRVQASFRGYLARPRPPRLRARETLTPAESNRWLVADVQAILLRAGLPTIPGVGPDGRKESQGADWGRATREAFTRQECRHRLGATHSGYKSGDGLSRSRCLSSGGRELRRSRPRKLRAFEDEMGTQITRVVRGFLERKRYWRRWAAWEEARREASAARIQHAWRGYRKRMGWKELESGVTDCAATMIQARWRGKACRMALARWSLEDALRKRKMVSAVTVQAAARRRIAVSQFGPKLTLGVARRQREARVAAEALIPRRRWNRSGPGSTTGGGVGGTPVATSIAGAKELQADGSRSDHKRRSAENAKTAAPAAVTGRAGMDTAKGQEAFASSSAEGFSGRLVSGGHPQPTGAYPGKSDNSSKNIRGDGVVEGGGKGSSAVVTMVGNTTNSPTVAEQDVRGKSNEPRNDRDFAGKGVEGQSSVSPPPLGNTEHDVQQHQREQEPAFGSEPRTDEAGEATLRAVPRSNDNPHTSLTLDVMTPATFATSPASTIDLRKATTMTMASNVVNTSSNERDADGKTSIGIVPAGDIRSISEAKETERLDGRGVRFEAGAGQSTRETEKRVSEKASVDLVQGSIQAALDNTESQLLRTSDGNGGIHTLTTANSDSNGSRLGIGEAASNDLHTCTTISGQEKPGRVDGKDPPSRGVAAEQTFMQGALAE